MAQPLRILFLAWGYSIHGERRIRLFAEDPSFSVAIASPYDYGIEHTRYLRLPEISARVAPGFESAQLARALHKMRRFANTYRPDIVFLQTLLYPSFLGLALPARIPKMITFWNGDLLSYTYSTGVERLFKHRILRRGLRSAAAVTVNSEAARQACLAHGAKASKVHVVRYPGIDLSRFTPMDKDEAKQALGFRGHEVILNERGTVAHKNADMLVRAAPGVLARFPNAKFLFLSPDKGAGAETFAPYQRLARDLGVDHAMVWRGNVGYDDLPAVVNAADVWVSLSTHDSMPNSMLDAMACGVPVVSADLPQIREWITDGITGRLVDPFQAEQIVDQLVTTLAQPTASLRMAENARASLAGRADTESQVAEIKRRVRECAAGLPKEPPD